MDEATIALTVMTGFLLFLFIGLFIWGWRSGQFKNIEEAKFIIFRENRSSRSPETEKPEAGVEEGGANK